jgi:TonB family protein
MLKCKSRHCGVKRQRKVNGGDTDGVKERKVIVNIRRVRVAVVLLFFSAGAFVWASDAPFPKPVASAFPMYPEQARAARVAGNVKMSFVLNRKGEVTDATVISGNPLLREAALSAVKSWRFPPEALRSNVHFETEFIYVLNVQPKEGEPTLKVSMTDFRRVEVVSELYVKAIE